MTKSLLISFLLIGFAEFLTRGALIKRITLLKKYKAEESSGGVPNLNKSWKAHKEITLILYVMLGRFKKAKDIQLKAIAEIMRAELIILLALAILCFLAVKGY